VIYLEDINGNIKPPEGFKLYRVSASGAFLVLEYDQNACDGSGPSHTGVNYVNIYVNDMSREVLRTSWTVGAVQDWGMNEAAQQAGHQPYTWKEIFKFVWRRLS